MKRKAAILKDIPFEKFYQSSRKESSRKKPVFFIHKYFARRITTNSRLSLLASLTEEGSNLYEKFYEKSEKHEDFVVLDPFMGGGTTILESARFGCKIIGKDLQPLSNFVSKALVKKIEPEKIYEAVNELEEKVGDKIKNYYKTKCPECGKDADIMYAFHVKKALTNSRCHEHKLFNSFVISLKKDVFTIICPKCGRMHRTSFKDGEYECECGFIFHSPNDSFINRGVFHCPECNEEKVISDYKEENEYPFKTEIIALEYCCPHCKSHDFKAADSFDKKTYEEVQEIYENQKNELPIPQQQIPDGYNTNQIINHGYRYFKDLFNKRQLLCLGMLLKEINNVKDKDVQFWLQLAFSGMLEMNNMFCRYQANANKLTNLFFNHAYVPINMPVENNVWGTTLGTGSFTKTIAKIIKGKEFNQEMYDIMIENESDKTEKIYNEDKVECDFVENFEDLDKGVMLKCGDSRDLSFIPDSSVDLVLTDPPYGANIMYSELIDFFHVWNTLSSLSQELGFTSELSPKDNEIIVNKLNKKYDYYENGISTVFNECHRKLKEDGLLIFSFHDKSMESWLSVLNSIYKSGFYLAQSYPLQSETRSGAHTSNKDSIGIDIMLVCEKIKRENDNELEEFSADEKNEIDEKITNILRRMESVNAEVTMPDVENIAIAEIFKEASHYKIYNNGFSEYLLNFAKNYIKDLENKEKEFKIVKKRKGWWSELYKQKWQI